MAYGRSPGQNKVLYMYKAQVKLTFPTLQHAADCVNGAVEYAKINCLQFAMPLITQKCSSLLR